MAAIPVHSPEQLLEGVEGADLTVATAAAYQGITFLHHAPCTMHHAPCTMHHHGCGQGAVMLLKVLQRTNVVGLKRPLARPAIQLCKLWTDINIDADIDIDAAPLGLGALRPDSQTDSADDSTHKVHMHESR